MFRVVKFNLYGVSIDDDVGARNLSLLRATYCMTWQTCTGAVLGVIKGNCNAFMTAACTGAEILNVAMGNAWSDVTKALRIYVAPQSRCRFRVVATGNL